MMQVKSYNNGLVQFYCSECGLSGERNISELLSDNCALSTEIVCPKCGSVYMLYVLRCTDGALMKSLNAELIALKEKNKKELED